MNLFALAFLLIAQSLVALFFPPVYAVLMALPIVGATLKGVKLPMWVWGVVATVCIVPFAAFVHSVCGGAFVFYMVMLHGHDAGISFNVSQFTAPKELTHVEKLSAHVS